MSAAGYIPEGGVWTAEERRRIGPGRKVLTAGEAARAAETVAALIRTLGDEHSLRIPPRLHANRATCRTCALLAALRGEK